MSRFFTEPENISDKYIYITDADDIHHIKKVLRLKPGDTVEISDGQKWEYEGDIEEITATEVTLRITDKQSFAREPETRVTLFQGIPKAGKMDLIVQKCVELGIDSIVPAFMERTVVNDNGKIGKKTERWQKISDEACKQCRRGIVPGIADAVNHSEMMNMLKDFDLVLFPYENETGRTIKDALRNLKDKPETVAIVIGPEGGFSDSEAEDLRKYECVSLGKTILRTETAGIAALAMTMYELEL